MEVHRYHQPMTTALPGRRWWHLAWSLPVAVLVSLPLFAYAALSLAVPPVDLSAAVLVVLVIGVCFFAAGLPVRQRTAGRRFAFAGVTAAAGVLLTVVMLAVIV